MKSSSFEEFPQGNGAKWVIQTHIDDNGGEHFVTTLHPESFDVSAILDATAAQIEADIVRAEIAANTDLFLEGNIGSITFKFSSKDDLKSALTQKQELIESAKEQADIKLQGITNVDATLASIGVAADPIIEVGGG